MYDVDLMTGYNTLHYLFGIPLCSMVAKCFKLSKMQKIHYFLAFLHVKCLFLADTDSEEEKIFKP